MAVGAFWPFSRNHYSTINENKHEPWMVCRRDLYAAADTAFNRTGIRHHRTQNSMCGSHWLFQLNVWYFANIQKVIQARFGQVPKTICFVMDTKYVLLETNTKRTTYIYY
jgi:hypothetical protein